MSKRVRVYGRSRINERRDALADRALMLGVALLLVLYVTCFALVLPADLVFGPFAALLVAGLIPTRIDVGDDGVLISWLGSRFLPYADIVDLGPAGRDLVLRTTSGALVRLPVGPGPPLSPNAYQKRQRLYRVLEDRRAQHQRLGETESVARLVEQNGRDPLSWARDLRALVSGSPFRAMTAEPEALWRLLEDPSAHPEARVGAAVALQGSGTAARERIRLVADATASPRVRVALEALASDESVEGQDASAKALARFHQS